MTTRDSSHHPPTQLRYRNLAVSYSRILPLRRVYRFRKRNTSSSIATIFILPRQPLSFRPKCITIPYPIQKRALSTTLMVARMCDVSRYPVVIVLGELGDMYSKPNIQWGDKSFRNWRVYTKNGEIRLFLPHPEFNKLYQ